MSASTTAVTLPDPLALSTLEPMLTAVLQQLQAARVKLERAAARRRKSRHEKKGADRPWRPPRIEIRDPKKRKKKNADDPDGAKAYTDTYFWLLHEGHPPEENSSSTLRASRSEHKPTNADSSDDEEKEAAESADESSEAPKLRPANGNMPAFQ